MNNEARWQWFSMDTPSDLLPTKSNMISIEPNRRPSRCSLSGFCFLIWYSLNASDCHLHRMTNDAAFKIVNHSYPAERAVQPSWWPFKKPIESRQELYSTYSSLAREASLKTWQQQIFWKSPSHSSTVDEDPTSKVLGVARTIYTFVTWPLS
jgi:hypothetical protein